MIRRKPIPPESVVSPKDHWTLIDVLKINEVEGTSLALGRWNREVTLVMRWNGDEENPIGHPQSRGLPVWFVLPREYQEAVLVAAKLPPEKMVMVRNFLPER
jgi:hypothetical protein